MNRDKLTLAVNVSGSIQTADADETAKLDTDDELEAEIKPSIPSPNKEKSIENVENQQNVSKVESGRGNGSQVGNIIPDMVVTVSTATTPSSFLSMPCRTIRQVICELICSPALSNIFSLIDYLDLHYFIVVYFDKFSKFLLNFF